MEAATDWYTGIEKEISSLKEEMSKGDFELYELDLLLRVAKQVAPQAELLVVEPRLQGQLIVLGHKGY